MTSVDERIPLASELPVPGDPYLHLRLRRTTLTTGVVSIIAHLLVLFAVPRPRLDPGEIAAGATGIATMPLQAYLTPPARTPSVVAAPSDAPPSTAPQRTRRTERRLLQRPPDPLAQSPAVPVAPPVPADSVPDLASLVQARQAQRRAAQGLPPLEPEAATPSGGEDQARLANVMRNLRVGTNGLFQIVSMDARRAAFTFRGWTTDISQARREYISVDIGTNPNIELATVRKMIELIRRHYQGNFNWESQRLDRVVTLSARLEDSEGLEEFLLKEFFGGRVGR